MSVRLSTTLSALALCVAGWAADPVEAPPNLPAQPGFLIAASSGVPASASALADGASIPVALLLDLAAGESPNQQALEAKRATAAAVINQARVWSNPELELSAGRARAREADANGVRQTTTIGSIGLKQRIELPGKRSARIAAAEAARDTVERSAAVDRLELAGEVRAAALAVAAADARVVLTQHGIDLSTQVQEAVERRLRAGEDDRGDLARTQVELANARLNADGATADAEAARRVLLIWCGSALPARYTIADALDDAPPAIDLAAVLRQAVTNHPGLALFDAAQAAGRASIAAEERAWYPDLTLGVSAGRESDTNDLGVSLGIELPLWNRNASGVAQARAEVARLHAERRKEAQALNRRITAAWNAYERERRQIAGLTTGVLPAAADARALKLGAFQAGEATLLDVIDARRTELDAQTTLAESCTRAAQARIDLFQAAGDVPIADAPPQKPSINATSPTSAGAQP